MENNSFIHGLLETFAAAGTDKTAFSVYDGEKVVDIPYGQFLADIRNAAGYFYYGKIKYQHIAIVAENSYDWLVVFFAIMASGNTAVPLNQDLPGDLLLEQCGQADISLICCDNNGCPDFGKVFGKEKLLKFEDIRAGYPIPMDAIHRPDPDDTTAMIFTSGTTGKSKIVEFSNRNILCVLSDLEEIVSAPLMWRTFLTFPLYHISGLITVLALLRKYHTICIGRGVRYLLLDVPKFSPSFVPMVPSILSSLAKLLRGTKTLAERKKYIGSNLLGVSIAGASADVSLCRYVMDLGIQIQSTFGMTESAGPSTWCVWSEDTIGSIGKPFGSTVCRIENGELLLKGPAVMKGYYKDPEETAKILENGWLHTGDLAHCDENGYYYLIGRKKNVMILSNGENVNPEEIEAAFSECPEILESMVYNDAKGICADVYTKEKAACAAFIRKYNDSVPLYRQVYQVNYSAAPLEKTGTGKIKRKENAYV